MKKVLIVAYAFPPIGGAGVQRPVKFIKYLSEFGWEPMVLTVENPSVPLSDDSLLNDIPAGTKVFRARTLEPSYSAKQSFKSAQSGGYSIKTAIKKILYGFMIPDVQILWWPAMVVAMFDILRREKPGCIFVTAPPFSPFIPSILLGKLFGIPVVLDYRDAWLFSRKNWEQANKNRLAFFMDSMLERLSLQWCHAYTTASQRYVADISARYGVRLGNRGKVITNGYDAEDFSAHPEETSSGADDGKLTIMYAGTVWSATSLENFTEALVKLVAEYPETKGKLRVKIFGRVVESEQAFLEADALCGIVESFGYIEHDRVVREIRHADVLLITLSDLPGADEIITAKAFEYMAAGKHILAVVPEGETRSILQQNYNKLTIAGAASPEDIMTKLQWLLENRELIREVMPNDVSRFSRKNLTEELAAIFDTIAA